MIFANTKELSPGRVAYEALKRFADIFAALDLQILTGPIFMPLGLTFKLESPGPVLMLLGILIIYLKLLSIGCWFNTFAFPST